MRDLGFDPDPWQRQVLEGGQPRLLLNCCRQAGKSTVVALLGLFEALVEPLRLVLLVSRSHRQSTELFRIVTNMHARLGGSFLKRKTIHELEFTSGSRIICLPCAEPTVRGYSGVTLLVIDEAARVPDDLYRAVRPMLAVSGGRLICLSTPYGKRGFFYQAWARGGPEWARIEVPAQRVPRITADFLEQERRALGESWFRQEYECSFGSVAGLVYPDFAKQVTGGRREQVAAARAYGKKLGGIDFGFRNPFAAVWGHLDFDDVLWLTGEHYQRERPLSSHAQHLPRDFLWLADPEGAGEISELRGAGFKVRKAKNQVQLGLQAVRARLETGRLRVVDGCCPNLLAEAELYRYDTDDDKCSEKPLKEHDHALDALRYLVLAIDAHKLARGWRRWLPRNHDAEAPPPLAKPKPLPWLSLQNEALWTAVATIDRH
jgi:hypothetical protein